MVADGPPFKYASYWIEALSWDWLVMVPGLGHLHMNQMKTLFKVLDDVLLKPLGKEVLHFSTQKAYNYFRSATDTHKTWQGLEVLLHGTACEMVELFIANTDEEITSENIMTWAKTNSNKTFQLHFDLILTYALSIYVQKMSVRCNDKA